MIPIEMQVTSLEPSIRLKELKCSQDTVYFWLDINDDDKPEGMVFRHDELESLDAKNCYSAFTVAEHGIALPRSIRSYRDTNAKEEFWVCKLPFKHMEYADTEANARAKMRIWLIEQKLVEEP